MHLSPEVCAKSSLGLHARKDGKTVAGFAVESMEDAARASRSIAKLPEFKGCVFMACKRSADIVYRAVPGARR